VPDLDEEPLALIWYREVSSLSGGEDGSNGPCIKVCSSIAREAPPITLIGMNSHHAFNGLVNNVAHPVKNPVWGKNPWENFLSLTIPFLSGKVHLCEQITG
jgi:hypothetical protein